jgi:hypothetical protein
MLFVALSGRQGKLLVFDHGIRARFSLWFRILVAAFVVYMVKVDLETENRFLREEQAGRDQWRRVLDGEEQLT